jgi:hypothetical protein
MRLRRKSKKTRIGKSTKLEKEVVLGSLQSLSPLTGFGSRAAMQLIVYVRDKHSATDLQIMQDGRLTVLCLDAYLGLFSILGR